MNATPRFRRLPGQWGYVKERGPNGRGLCRECGQEVPVGRRTFCGEACIHEWKLKSDPGYLRQMVKNRDHMVCALCGKQCSYNEPWEADHAVPLVEGGANSLENCRTLCLDCHRGETAKLAARRAEARRIERRGGRQLPMEPA